MILKSKLGKIENIYLGIGGYQDAQFGLFISFTFDTCCGIGTQEYTFWSLEVECSKHCKWSEQDRDSVWSGIGRRICELLHDAKKKRLEDLKGVPVELTLENDGSGPVKAWRILKEVL